ncbi:MAG: nucleotidyltransferase domain-containing protein [Candidatus Methanoperedens sp.]|nr:nucleotidyltransferase domain-containing protein [Candidatus Methanoperedens sp.]
MENILGTRTAIKILSCLMKHPQKEFKEIDLIKESKVGKGVGAAAINNFYLSNILTIKRAGKTKVIRLNALNPVTFAIRQLFDQYKFLQLPENKISAVLLFKKKACLISRSIIIFGSLAAGTHDENSDIDLLVIIDDKKKIDGIKKISDQIHELIGEYINIHFITSQEAKNEMNTNELIRTALIYGILVYGGDHVRELMKPYDDINDLISIRERINAALRNYSNKDLESALESGNIAAEEMAFLACKLEGLDVYSRKDASSTIAKIKEYKALSEMEKLGMENMLEVLENIYLKIFQKKIRKGESIER